MLTMIEIFAVFCGAEQQQEENRGPYENEENSRQREARYDNSNTFRRVKCTFVQFTRLLAYSASSVWISLQIHLSTIGTLYKAPPLLYSVLYIFFVPTSKQQKNFSEFHTVENIEYLQRAKKRSTVKKEAWRRMETGYEKTGLKGTKRKWGIVGISLAYLNTEF